MPIKTNPKQLTPYQIPGTRAINIEITEHAHLTLLKKCKQLNAIKSIMNSDVLLFVDISCSVIYWALCIFFKHLTQYLILPKFTREWLARLCPKQALQFGGKRISVGSLSSFGFNELGMQRSYLLDEVFSGKFGLFWFVNQKLSKSFTLNLSFRLCNQMYPLENNSECLQINSFLFGLIIPQPIISRYTKWTLHLTFENGRNLLRKK